MRANLAAGVGGDLDGIKSGVLLCLYSLPGLFCLLCLLRLFYLLCSFAALTTVLILLALFSLLAFLMYLGPRPLTSLGEGGGNSKNVSLYRGRCGYPAGA